MLEQIRKWLYKKWAWLMWLPYHWQAAKALKEQQQKKEAELLEELRKRTNPAKLVPYEVDVKKRLEETPDDEAAFEEWKSQQ